MSQGSKLIGITECRFEPLHNGHVYMVMMAYQLLKMEALVKGVDFVLHVIVCSHDGEILSGHKRFLWAKRTFGGYENIRVHHAHNSLEHVQGYGTDYEGPGYKTSWEFWAKVAMEQCGLGDTIDYVYGSEGYVEGIAKHCSAKPVLVDQDRDAITISGTTMRNSPYDNWDYFPDAVRSDFAKKVCLIGAPYTGKKKLATALSQHYRTPLIGDVSDAVYNPDMREFTREDLEQIARLHTARADALMQQVNRVAISDSDTLLTAAWYEWKFDESMSDWMLRQSKTKRFDLYVFTESAGREFRPSNTFKEEAEWHEFSDHIKNTLDEFERPYICVQGPVDRQLSTAVPAIDNMEWFATHGKVGWYPGSQDYLGYVTP